MLDQPLYSIGAVARMLRVPAATLRNWQDRYGLVVPERSAGGHRLYSRQHVEQLLFIRDNIASGLSSADAHRLLQQRLDAGDVVKCAENPEGEQILILLAEHDPYAADFAEYFLRTEGYHVLLVNSADQATAGMSGDVTLAVIDLLISDGRGLQLCTQIRNRFDVPVLAICTLAMRDKALDAGASAFLKKPVEPLQMLSAIKDLFGRSAFLQRKGVKP